MGSDTAHSRAQEAPLLGHVIVAHPDVLTVSTRDSFSVLDRPMNGNHTTRTLWSLASLVVALERFSPWIVQAMGETLPG